jgi:hypothetical protein
MPAIEAGRLAHMVYTETDRHELNLPETVQEGRQQERGDLRWSEDYGFSDKNKDNASPPPPSASVL